MSNINIEFKGVNICQNCTIRILNGLQLSYYLSNVLVIVQVDRSTLGLQMTGLLTLKILFILEFPPNLVPGQRSCIFRPHYLKKERSWQFIDARFELYTKKYSQIHCSFQICGGFHNKFMALLTSFTPLRVFDGNPPQISDGSYGKTIGTMMLKFSGFSYLIIIYHHT